MDQLNLEREKNKVFLRFCKCQSLLHCVACNVLLLQFRFCFVCFLTYNIERMDGQLPVSLFFSSKCLYVHAGNLNKHMFICVLAAEEEILFPPTYRYERGSRDTYVWQKQKATGVNFPNSLFVFIQLILLILLFLCLNKDED